jgi:hypothetical protein
MSGLPITPAIQEQLISKVTGPFGALTLAVVLLWIIMGNYQSLIDQMITDHAADREMYRSTMIQLSTEMNRISVDLKEIHVEVQEIRRDIRNVQ